MSRKMFYVFIALALIGVISYIRKNKKGAAALTDEQIINQMTRDEIIEQIRITSKEKYTERELQKKSKEELMNLVLKQMK